LVTYRRAIEGKTMRRVIVGVSLAIFAAASAAQAADYVVVKSTDPSIRAGATLDGGQRVSLGAGRTLTLIAAAGDVTMLTGGPSGAMAPVRRSAQADAGKLESLRALIDPPPTGRTFGGRRGGVCPDPATLKTLDEILAVQQADCAPQARTALEALASNASRP
jgi:hypothetical protein